MRDQILFLLALFLTQSLAWADDSVEAPVLGNIVFEKSPELVMQDETLVISKGTNDSIGQNHFSIDVNFHFKNISNQNVTKKIAFVLPPIQCRMDTNSAWRGFGTSDEVDTNNMSLKDFTTTVDGQVTPYTTRTEAMLGNKNITALLIKLKIPLNPCQIQTTTDGNPDPKYGSILKKHHLLTETNEAAWSENIYFEWTQHFPAGKVINVHHHYTPVIGGSVLSPRNTEELNYEFTQNIPPLKPIWNRSPHTLSATNPNILDSSKQRFCVMPKWIQYHLTTGSNWNNGIGVFKLIITDATDTPFAVNEFYTKRDNAQIDINKNTMTFTINHFVPTKNLLVQFLSIPHSSEELQACGYDNKE